MGLIFETFIDEQKVMSFISLCCNTKRKKLCMGELDDTIYGFQVACFDGCLRTYGWESSNTVASEFGGEGGHFHINIHGTCRFSGYQFSAKIPEPVRKIDQKFRNRS